MIIEVYLGGTVSLPASFVCTTSSMHGVVRPPTRSLRLPVGQFQQLELYASRRAVYQT